MKRAAYLDRYDNRSIDLKPREGQYVTRREEVQILPGAPEAIGLLTQAGFCVVAERVAKGLLTLSELESIHARMCQELAAKMHS